MANEIILQRLGNEYTTGSTTKAYYKFFNNLLDSSSNHYNGTSGSSTTYVNGIYDKALVLSGINYACNFSNPVIPTGKKSISFWMYDTGTPTYSMLLGNSYVFGGTTGTTIYSNGNGNISFQIRGGDVDSSTYGLYTLASTGLVQKQWYWVVCQWDGTNNTNSGKIYVNGVLNANSTNSKSEAATTSNFYIGKHPGDGTRFWYGYLDELIIRDEVWTTDEMTNYYNYYNPNKYILLTGSTSYVNIMQSYITNANTKLYYNFDNSTATNYDGVTGTTTGVTYGDGIYSKYIQFTGSTASSVNFNFDIDVTGSSITVLTWLYVDMTTAGTDRQPIIGTSYFCNNMILFESNLASLNWFSVKTWGSNGSWCPSNTFSISSGWMFVAITHNISTDKVNYYYTVNGVYKSDLNCSFVPVGGAWLPGDRTNDPLRIIGKPSNTWQFKGRMDEIIVENRLWTDDEVYNYFQQSRARVLGVI